MQFFRDLHRFLRNVWAYRDILWRDRDWDHTYLLAMIERKLDRMYTELSNPKLTVAIHSAKELRRLKMARELARRIVQGEHTDLAGLPAIKAKYGEDWWDDNDPARARALTEWARHATYLENQDWAMLFDTLKKFGRVWWD